MRPHACKFCCLVMNLGTTNTAIHKQRTKFATQKSYVHICSCLLETQSLVEKTGWHCARVMRQTYWQVNAQHVIVTPDEERSVRSGYIHMSAYNYTRTYWLLYSELVV